MAKVVGEVTGTDMRANDNAYDESKLLDKISQNLQDVEGLDAEPVNDSTPVESDDSADDSDSTPPIPTKKKAAVEDDSTPDDEDNESADTDTEADDKPAIPDNYYRAAVHQGLEPEDIKQLYDANPKKALKTLKNLYEVTNNLSQQFAQRGRLAAQQKQTQTQTQTQQQPQQPTVVQTQSVNMKKLKEQYEDDPFGAIAELIKVSVGQQTQPAVQPVAVSTATEQPTFQEQLAAYNDVVNFFKDEDLKDYDGLYGADQNNLTPGQIANRNAVTETADAIIDGMKLEGRTISNSDALMRAHLIVSAPIAEQIVRNKIVKSAKKREKGITLRPSKSKSSSPKIRKGGKSDEQREADAQARLDAMF